MTGGSPDKGAEAAEQQAAASALATQKQLQQQLDEEKAKKAAEDARVQALKVKALRVQSTGGGGLFGSGNQTLG